MTVNNNLQSLLFKRPYFSVPYFRLDTFKSGYPDKVENWVQNDWVISFQEKKIIGLRIRLGWRHKPTIHNSGFILPCLMGHRIGIWVQKYLFYAQLIGQVVGPMSVTPTVAAEYTAERFVLQETFLSHKIRCL